MKPKTGFKPMFVPWVEVIVNNNGPWPTFDVYVKVDDLASYAEKSLAFGVESYAEIYKNGWLAGARAALFTVDRLKTQFQEAK